MAYYDQVYDVINRKSDFDKLTAQLTTEQKQSLYADFDASLMSLSQDYRDMLGTVTAQYDIAKQAYAGSALRDISTTRNKLAATGGLGSTKYADQIKEQYNQQITELGPAYQKSVENIYSDYEKASAKLSEYTSDLGTKVSKLNRYVLGTIDPNVVSEDGEWNADVLESSGYIAYNSKTNSYAVTDKWRDAWAQFVTGPKSETYRSELYGIDSDLYAFYTDPNYNWFAVQAGAQINQEQYEALRSATTPVTSYADAATKEAIKKFKESNKNVSADLQTAYDTAITKPDITGMSSADITTWVSALNTTTGTTKASVNGTIVKANTLNNDAIRQKTRTDWYKNNTTLVVDGQKFKLSDKYATDLGEYSRVDKGSVSITLADGTTDTLDKLVANKKISVGDTFKYSDGNYYLVIRADNIAINSPVERIANNAIVSVIKLDRA